MSSDRRKADALEPIAHGASQLPSVVVASYNVELRDGDGFVGDRANNRAFRAIVESWRERLRSVGEDPLGAKPTEELSKKKLDKVLAEGEPEAAAVVQGAVEEFAAELAFVIERLRSLKSWRDVERIVIGGGLRGSRVGELAIGRASVSLKASGIVIDLQPIRHDPDEAGLIGALQLVPAWMLEGHDAILAVDIGGSNIRAGIVKLELRKDESLAEGRVHELDLWCHAGEKTPPTRDAAVERIQHMLERLVRHADKADLKLAPFVGLACPGVIADDGHIERGGQNLPGNWESSRFNLPRELRRRLPTIGKHDTTVVMHNDAVVQGLSELPYTRGLAHWGVLTIGTGLGNATFANREKHRAK